MTLSYDAILEDAVVAGLDASEDRNLLARFGVESLPAVIALSQKVQSNFPEGQLTLTPLSVRIILLHI